MKKIHKKILNIAGVIILVIVGGIIGFYSGYGMCLLEDIGY